MKSIRILAVLLSIGLLAVGCSQEPEMTAPQTQTQYHYDKNGTETLGTPTIAIASGSCFAQGGVGMVGVDSGIIDITVPVGATINQVLVYWAGGTTGAPGDDIVKIDGNDVTGELIGGPTNFFSNYWFSAYRADITAMGLVTDGANSFTITEFDFDYTGGSLDENNGIGMMVIYDDGTLAEISVLDGLDMAYFDFSPTLDATVPQTFTFAAEPADRMSRMVIFAGSVGLGRPNAIKFTTSAGDDVRDNLLGSDDGLLWDTLCLTDILIPAGDTSVTVELISTVTPLDPVEDRGASMAWVGAGFSIPVTPPPLACLGDYVWHDINEDGIQDAGEAGVEGVTVYLMDCQGGELASTTTDASGYYLFCELEPGDYNVKFMLPAGYVFSPQDQGGDDALDSDADPVTGVAACTTLDPGEHDMTWDAGIFIPIVEDEGCRLTGGCNDEFFFEDGSFNEYTCGGQAGAPLASQPQPWGNWTHNQKKGPAGSFTFHAGTPSAPEGTEIDWIECMDPGWCVQARPAPTKQLDFAGVGTFKNMKGAPAEIANHVDVGESLHWFEVNIDDLGEPGSHTEPEGCEPLGYGRNGGAELADCGCPDFYRIRIYEGMDDSSAIMYEVYGYIDGGNFQIHPPTGRDQKEWN
ncbi:MAG: SdrD B-like domain-containing protein [Candidatus Krumholzibacteriota bacterium]